MSRAVICFFKNLPHTTRSRKVIWEPLNLHDEDNAQSMADRQLVLSFLREIYDPPLTEWLAAGKKWSQIFQRQRVTRFILAICSRLDDLPASVRVTENDMLLAQILFDVLRFYRFSDRDWRAPLGGPPVPDSPRAPTVCHCGSAPTASSEPALDTTALDVLAYAASLDPRYIPKISTEIFDHNSCFNDNTKFL
ncbi:unnamed protein product [Penicillium bialowiezense]